MESVKEKIKELISWIEDNGYPMGKLMELENVKHYRLDDRFFIYDLYEKDCVPVTLIVGMQGDKGVKYPLWAAVFHEGELVRFLSGRDVFRASFFRRHK